MAENKKKNKFSLRKLIYNDKYLIIISIVLAVVIWVVTSINLSPETTKTISVPVSVDFTGSAAQQLGLKCYGEQAFDVDVTVSCKKYLAKDITADKLKVYLQTNVVTSSGTFDVPIKVESNESADFKITSFYPTVYRSYFDFEEEKNMDLEIKYANEDFIEDGYVMGQPLLSQSTVTIKGPRNYVSQVASVNATVKIDEKLNKTKTMDINAVALDSYNSKVNYVSVDSGKESLTITIPVLKKANLDVSASFVGKPSKISTSAFNISYSVNRVNCGVLEEANIDTANVGEINFSQLKPGVNKFSFETKTLDSFVILDDIDNIDVSVTVPDNYVQKDVYVSYSSVKLINIPKGYSAYVTGINDSSVTVVGTKESIKNLSSSNVSLIVDFSKIDEKDLKEGSNTFKITTALENSDTSWIYGDYEAYVRVSKA